MRKALFSFSLLVVALAIIGCKPYMGEKFIDIKPNETAFVVPFEGASKTNQGKFDSVDFLEERKVASKRINISRRYRSIGRMPGSYDIVDTVRVITVDRSPVSRHWTADRQTGTTDTDDAIYVESQDSIGFGLGVNITAAVEEPDTATYLYNFPQSRPLHQVVDSDVKSFITAIMAREFGTRDLAACKTDKSEVFKVIREETIPYWKKFGITIRTIGLSGGLTYENPQIQQVIDENYAAEMLIEKRENEARAQKHENDRLFSIEENNRLRAEEFNKALEAQTAKIQLEIERMRAEADLERAKRWDGKLPANMMPENSQFLFSLDTDKATN